MADPRARRILIVGEGPHELGGEPGIQSPSRENLASLPRLVHRLIGEPVGVEYNCLRHKDIRPVHPGPGNRWEKKVIQAMRQTPEHNCAAVVFVVDRDCEQDSERITPMKSKRDEVRGQFVPCAIGAAVETFDAWMIADQKAIRNAGGNPDEGHPSPEKLDGKKSSGNHPKDHAQRAFAGCSLPEKYAIVAAAVDLDLLEKSCPAGFKPFARDARDNLGGLFGP